MMTTMNKVMVAFLIGMVLAFSYAREFKARTVADAQREANKSASDRIAANEQKNRQELAEALKGLEEMKRQVKTPAQIVRALPKVVDVPAPIVEVTPEQVKAVNALPDTPSRLKDGDLIIPAESAKAFYDSQVDCKANAVKLASCQVTVGNRDAELSLKDAEVAQLNMVLKGGTKWARAKGALKFIGVGVVVGAATSAYFLAR
ncbi:hypothetical protein [Edaphobacter albus]|uniref:hypothetical protein n=1 Tax=Edaphobacter sp. 4G125 TaxID=2763071 RepID=UPI001647F5C3|nr:hypothetical protein [Edaphobacter sp. 4G125]QNI37535.1 hypothetical protein H7846_04320 [Edaphobacter sp. 4G125]